MSEEVCDGLAIACWNAKGLCSRFKPWPGQTFGLRFLFHAHPTPPLGLQVSGYQSQSEAWNSPRVRKRGSNQGVQILLSLRKNMREIQWHRQQRQSGLKSRGRGSG